MSSSSGSGVRFAPGPFKYNGRVALALVPALLVAAGLGGRAVMGIFTIGTMLWYIMDAMQYREGAFSVVCGWSLDVVPLSAYVHAQSSSSDSRSSRQQQQNCALQPWHDSSCSWAVTHRSS